MLIVKPITKAIKHDKITFKQVTDLYRSAFPRQEQAPLAFIINQTKRDTVAFRTFYDDDIFVGFAYTMTFGDVTYLWYLAVRKDIRAKGYGSKIMKYLKDEYADNRIVLNLDVQDENAPDCEIRKKRKNFYAKNGYSPAKFKCNFNRNELDVVCINGEVSADEFLSVFKDYFGAVGYFFYKPKIIFPN